MRYRPHRGTLSDAMKEEVNYNSIDEMKAAISCEYFDAEDIIIKKDSSFDARIGYAVASVCVNRFGMVDYIKEYGCPQCIGFVEVKELSERDIEKLHPDLIVEGKPCTECKYENYAYGSEGVPQCNECSDFNNFVPNKLSEEEQVEEAKRRC